MVWLTKFVVRSLEFARRHLPARLPKHLLTGERGELEAYLYLRDLGYTIVAANFRVPYDRGEIDLIGWDAGVLCFIEVKTRTGVGFAPPATAVDRSKRRHILSVARKYVRRIPGNRPPCRFDIVSIIVDENGGRPRVSLHRGPLPGIATSREVTGAGTFVIGISGSEEGEQVAAVHRNERAFLFAAACRERAVASLPMGR